MKRLTRILIMALMAATIQLASAVNYSPSHLLLVFHQTGASDVIYDIGSVANYSGQPAGSISVIAYNHELVKGNFGGSLAGVKFGVVGENDSAGKVWLSDADLTDVPGALTPNTYATLQSKISSAGLSAKAITTNSAGPLVIDPSDPNSYSYIVSPGDSDNIDTFGGDAPFAVSTANPAQELFYQMSPNSAPSFLGTFTMGDDGNIVFTAGVSPLITGLSGPGVTVRGGNATFSVTVLNATGYQWYLDGVAVAGATNASLTVSNVQPGDVGDYTVVASDSADSTATASFTSKSLKITPAYVPSDLLLVFHDGTNADVEFNLGSVSNFQNQSSGTVLPVRYDQSLVLSNFGTFAGVSVSFVAESDSPLSRVWLSDATVGSVPSDLTPNTYATLQSKIDGVGLVAGSLGFPLVDDPSDANSYSSIVSPGDSGDVGTMGGDAPFPVGSAVPSHVAFYELHPTVSDPAEAATLGGYFALTADGNINFLASTTTNYFTSVIARPTITTQPAPATLHANQGASKTYTVVAANNFTGGTAFELAYQWRTNGTAIPGATASSYTISDVESANIGTYSVIVTSVGGSITSSNAVLTVVLDSTLPTVKIVTPANKGFTTNLTVTGTAKDTGSKIITHVFYGFNGGDVTNLATFTGGISTTTNWSAAASALPVGTNSYVVAQSEDLAGNLSAPVTNTFFYTVPQTLTLNIVGNGSVAPNGSKTYGAVPAAAGPVSTNVTLFVGKPYKLKVVNTATNFLYSNLVSSATGPSVLVTYPFTMTSNLSLTVNFVANRFQPVAGSYNGLFSDTSNGVSFASAGFANIKVKAKNYKAATYSGSLSVAGTKVKVAGTFGLDGNTLPGTNGVSLNLPFDGSNTMSGSVTIGTNVSQLSADLALIVTSYDGKYTMIVPGSTNGPAGDGFGLVIITNGVIKLVGTLGDGMAVSQTVPVSQTGDWPLYVTGYKDSSKVSQGVMLGWLAVTTNGPSGTNYWIKTGAAATTVAGGKVSPAGFTNAPVIQGSAYDPAAASMLEWTSGDLILQDGGLTTSTNTVTLAGFVFTPSSTNTVGVTNKMKLKAVMATGKLTGSFKNGTTNVTFTGAVLQNTTNAFGYFINGSQSGSFTVEGQ